MTLFMLLVALAVIGLAIGLLPIDPRFTQLLYILAVILVIVFLVTTFAPGLLHSG